LPIKRSSLHDGIASPWTSAPGLRLFCPAVLGPNSFYPYHREGPLVPTPAIRILGTIREHTRNHLEGPHHPPVALLTCEAWDGGVPGSLPSRVQLTRTLWIWLEELTAIRPSLTSLLTGSASFTCCGGRPRHDVFRGTVEISPSLSNA